MTATAEPNRSSSGTALIFFLAACGAGVVLSAWVAGGRPILQARWGLLWRLALWAAAWLVAVVAALGLPARAAPALIVCAALALRLAALAGPPTTSDDLYRYGWDGRVQAAGIDPYADPPSAPALARLHEPWLWPGPAGCADIQRPPGCTRLNRPAARTIYPPVAEAWFATVYRVAGIGARHKAWQGAGLLADVATVGLLVLALPRWGRDRRWAALYALCPAPVFEFVHNGHVDGLAVAFVVGALAVAAGCAPGRPRTVTRSAGSRRTVPRSVASWRTVPRTWRHSARYSSRLGGAGERCREGDALAPGTRHGTNRAEKCCVPGPHEAVRDVAVGLLLGAAILVKLYPAVLLVALPGMPRARPWRSAARAAAAAAALAVVAYLPHVLSVGTRVLGYLPGYLREEHYDKGGRFLIAGAFGFPPWASGALALTALTAVALGVAWRRPSAPHGAAVVLAALFLTITPVQPWYAVSLLPAAALAGWGWPAFLAPTAILAAGYAYYFAVILDYRHTVGLGRAAYGVALAVTLVVLGRRARRSAKPMQ